MVCVCQIGQEIGNGEQGGPSFSQQKNKHFKWYKFWVHGIPNRAEQVRGKKKNSRGLKHTKHGVLHFHYFYAVLEKID